MPRTPIAHRSRDVQKPLPPPRRTAAGAVVPLPLSHGGKGDGKDRGRALLRGVKREMYPEKVCKKQMRHFGLAPLDKVRLTLAPRARISNRTGKTRENAQTKELDIRVCRPLPCLREGEGGPTERDCEAIAFRRGKGFASAGSEPLLEDKIKNKRGTPLWLPLIREGLRLCTLHKRGTLYTFPRRKHSVGFAFFFLVLFLFSREKRKRTRPPTQLSRMFLIRSSIRSFRLELRAMRSSTRSMAWCTVE